MTDRKQSNEATLFELNNSCGICVTFMLWGQGSGTRSIALVNMQCAQLFKQKLFYKESRLINSVSFVVLENQELAQGKSVAMLSDNSGNT